jgi:hypothetical protein
MLTNLYMSMSTITTPNFLSLYRSGAVPNCSTLYLLDPGERYSVRSDGQLHHDGYGHTWGYCVETRVRDTGRDIMVLKCQEEEQEQCHRDNMEYHLLFTILGSISLLFLISTFIVYVSVPDLFNLHGKIVVSNITSIFLVTVYILIVYNVTLTSSIFCVILGYFGYFVSIAMFGWMTVICLDLSWTFCRSNIPRKGSDFSKFLSFSIIAWGLAALLTAIVFYLDMTLPDWSEWKPNIGMSSCFIEEVGNKRMIFFHIPILVLMVINMILYMVTIYNLTKHSKQTREVRQSRR